MQYEAVDETQLVEIADEFITELDPRAQLAQLVALEGELGAGKTTFVQKSAQILGVTDPIQSPTYVIERVYLLPEEADFRKLIHIDAYRLDDPEELLRLGWGEKIKNPSNLIMLEWPERVEDILPEQYHRLTFSVADEGTRDVSVTKVDE